ncbi:unnamed protein product [Owenia fusiformis]|uniref:Uncharacterized protein n=1 Tax=Owenia fusiformis TaxID=6347 RepID=A0A8J1UHZ5_OWEFU|nr:unnamed protein product [Owenia fusiformis]
MSEYGEHLETQGATMDLSKSSTETQISVHQGGYSPTSSEMMSSPQPSYNTPPVKKRSSGEIGSVLRCTKCPYSTRYYGNIYVHIRKHTGEKPYWCGACMMTFSQGPMLKQHIAKYHNGEKSYYHVTKSETRRDMSAYYVRIKDEDLPKYEDTLNKQHFLDQDTFSAEKSMKPSTSVMQSNAAIAAANMAMAKAAAANCNLSNMTMFPMADDLLKSESDKTETATSQIGKTMLPSIGLLPGMMPGLLPMCLPLTIPKPSHPVTTHSSIHINQNTKTEPPKRDDETTNGDEDGDIDTTKTDINYNPNRTMLKPSQYKGKNTLLNAERDRSNGTPTKPGEVDEEAEDLVQTLLQLAQSELKASKDSVINQADGKLPQRPMSNDYSPPAKRIRSESHERDSNTHPTDYPHTQQGNLNGALPSNGIHNSACHNPTVECEHSVKLEALRRNVMRLIQTLVPDMNIATMDIQGDNIDSLLQDMLVKGAAHGVL